MDDLKKLLSKKNIETPTEIIEIKDHIMNKIEEEVSIELRGTGITIVAPNSAAANAIRYELPYFKQRYKDKKIVIRIS